jgi:hypothetical protein
MERHTPPGGPEEKIRPDEPVPPESEHQAYGVTRLFLAEGGNYNSVAILGAQQPGMLHGTFVVLSSQHSNSLTRNSICLPKQNSVTPPEEYLARERQAECKSEYYAGEIFAMAV